MRRTVVDASVLVPLLLHTTGAPAVAATIRGDHLLAPAHIDAEVLHAVRRLTAHLPDGLTRGRAAAQALSRLPLARVAAPPVLELSATWWANATAYEALYFATAAWAGADRIVTRDRRWLGVPDPPTPVLVLS